MTTRPRIRGRKARRNLLLLQQHFWREIRETDVNLTRWMTGLAIILSLLSFQAHAQRKIDVVTLYNGDRLTGEIKKLFGGILEFSTDAMGTVKIEWPEISRIQSTFHYEVRLSSGERLYGSLDDSARPGQVALVDIFGKHELEWLQVTEIRPVEDSFAERLDVYLSAGYSYSKGSGVTQLTFNTQVGYEDENSRNELTARTDITDTDEDSTSSNRLDIQRSVWA